MKCPDELLSWWDGQLAEDGCYYDGYSEQFRGTKRGYDQIKGFLKDLDHPHSRRHCFSTWNSRLMRNITRRNKNKNTPACCHTTMLQAFVREGRLSFVSYQRSGDMLLGVPHNWVQTWAFLLYCCYHKGLKPGRLIWVLGDAHIYNHESHLAVVNDITMLAIGYNQKNETEMVYKGTDRKDEKGVPVFLADDFEVKNLAEPKVFGRPVMF